MPTIGTTADEANALYERPICKGSSAAPSRAPTITATFEFIGPCQAQEAHLQTLIRTILSGVFAILSTAGAEASSGEKMIATAKAKEKALGARIGVAVIDTRDNRIWSYRREERFPMASTSKTLACGALLASARQNKAMTISRSDLEAYSPVTEKLVGQRVPASDLCAATLRTSDNTAANKVLDAIGGPPYVTGFLRKLGDGVTRLDRREPDLNEGKPGDDRDTTTPAAMATTLQTLLLGDALGETNRRILRDWLMANEVGGPLIRAGVPKDWKVADRTGAGGFGTRGVAAVLWPPQRQPWVVVIYITQTSASLDARNGAIADIARAIVADITG